MKKQKEKERKIHVAADTPLLPSPPHPHPSQLKQIFAPPVIMVMRRLCQGESVKFRTKDCEDRRPVVTGRSAPDPFSP